MSGCGLVGGMHETARPRRATDGTLRFRRLGTLPFVLRLAGGVVGFLLFALLALVAAAFPEEMPGALVPILALMGATVAIVAWTLRTRAMGLRLEQEGVTITGFLRTSFVRWPDVSCVRADGYSVKLRGADTGGRSVRGRANVTKSEYVQLTDVLLLAVPRLALVAWGVGLPDVPEPARGSSALPDRVYQELDEITIEGPEGSRLVVPARHPRHAHVTDCLQARLLPRMVGLED